MKRIIGYDENGNPNCACDDGNVYTNCGSNCECCDNISASVDATEKSYTIFETLSCPCSFHTIKNKFGNIECELESYGVKNRIVPIKINNHTIDGRIPNIGDKWDCINSRTCRQGNIEWDALHVVSVESSNSDKVVSVVNSTRSTSNCYVPATSLSDFINNTIDPVKERLSRYGIDDFNYTDSNGNIIDIETNLGMVDNYPIFSNKDTASTWDSVYGLKSGKTSEYIDEKGVTRYLPGSHYPNRKLIRKCYINKVNAITTNDWNNKSLTTNESRVRHSGELLEIKIQGDNNPIVDIYIKDSSNRSLLKRKLKNIVIDGEYILKQNIPALRNSTTKETYTVEIKPSADTSYYYNGTLIPDGTLKHTISQFQNPTITLSYFNNSDLTNSNVSQAGTTSISAPANSYFSNPVTTQTRITRHTTSHFYYITKKEFMFNDLMEYRGGIKKFLNHSDATENLECRSNISVSDSNSSFTGDIEVGMVFNGKVEKTKTVFKSIDLDEHLKEPCDTEDITNILTNKFELENTVDLFSGMTVEGIDNDDLNFISTIENVDCNKNITLTSHHIIRKDTVLTFTYIQRGKVKAVEANNIEISPCIKLPKNTELSFEKKNRTKLNGSIRVDLTGAASMVVYTRIDSGFMGDDDATFALNVDKFISVSPPARDKYFECGKDEEVEINFNFNSSTYNVNDISVTTTTNPSNGTLATLKTPNPRWKTYTPKTGFTGKDKFKYTLSDGVNTSEEKTIFITVR
tara:strand:+ start:6253 stop:8487 length:2235 start_codon:yes stop_codon:yes gene_type:complete